MEEKQKEKPNTSLSKSKPSKFKKEVEDDDNEETFKLKSLNDSNKSLNNLSQNLSQQVKPNTAGHEKMNSSNNIKSVLNKSRKDLIYNEEVKNKNNISFTSNDDQSENLSIADVDIKDLVTKNEIYLNSKNEFVKTKKEIVNSKNGYKI